MYLIRLDDASDYMHVEYRNRVDHLLDENGIKPLASGTKLGISRTRTGALRCIAMTMRSAPRTEA